MSSVGSPSALDSALHGEVADVGSFHIEALGLGVGLQVLEELEHVSDRLLGETTLGHTVELGLGGSANVASESSVRNAIFVFEHILEVLDGSLQLEASDGSCCFISVLEVGSEVVNSAFGRYKREGKMQIGSYI